MSLCAEVEDKLAPTQRLTGLAAKACLGSPGKLPPWREGRTALTRCCCRLWTATAAADAALCRSSAACPGLSRLRVNLRVRSPAIAGRAARASAPERVCPAGSPGRASLFYPPAVQEAELGAFPPLFPAQLIRGGFFSRAPPLCPPPSLPLQLRGDFANSAPLRPHAANCAWLGRICSGSRGTRVGGDSTRGRPPETQY